MKQKWLERKDSLYSRCFHVVFTKVHESRKSGVPPVRIVQPTHGRDARATTAPVSQLSVERFVLSFLLIAVLPFGIDFGGQFSAANQLLQVPDDGAPGDFELAGQSGNVRALVGGGQHLAD